MSSWSQRVNKLGCVYKSSRIDVRLNAGPCTIDFSFITFLRAFAETLSCLNLNALIALG